jgi:hypothetical protein
MTLSFLPGLPHSRALSKRLKRVTDTKSNVLSSTAPIPGPAGPGITSSGKDGDMSITHGRMRKMWIR